MWTKRGPGSGFPSRLVADAFGASVLNDQGPDRPLTARPITAVDLVWRWTLQALLSEALRELGNALVADGDQRDDGEGAGVPHWVLRAEEDTPIGLPTERALEPGRVRRGFRDDLRLLVLIRLEVRRFILRA